MKIKVVLLLRYFENNNESFIRLKIYPSNFFIPYFGTTDNPVQDVGSDPDGPCEDYLEFMYHVSFGNLYSLSQKQNMIFFFVNCKFINTDFLIISITWSFEYLRKWTNKTKKVEIWSRILTTVTIAQVKIYKLHNYILSLIYNEDF